jgi:hypothetical protein
MSLKIPVTPRGIDPGTVRLVAQRLSHYATPVPLKKVLPKVKTFIQDARQARKCTLNAKFRNRVLKCTNVILKTHAQMSPRVTCHLTRQNTRLTDIASSHILACQLLSSRYVSCRSRSSNISTCLSRELVPRGPLNLRIPAVS